MRCAELKHVALPCAHLLVLITSLSVEVMLVNIMFLIRVGLQASFFSSLLQDIVNFWLGRSYFSFIFGFPLP